MRRHEPTCHACQGKLPLTDTCECGTVCSHTHHDYPDLSLDCPVCHDLCTSPIPVYSCRNCGLQFVYGEYGPDAKLHQFDNFQPCWMHRGSSDPKLLEGRA